MAMIFGLSSPACSPRAHGQALPQPVEDITVSAEAKQAQAVFAAGCFWCVEAVFQELQGVSEVESGYAGDSAESATYEIVSTGATRHAEAVRITYDPHQISYGQLLRIFFATHDPTTPDRQGPDQGHQYRSAIFYADDDQLRVAAAYINQLQQAGVYAPKSITTTLEPLTQFYRAEEYHQDFAVRNPDYPYVRHWIPGKLQKLANVAGHQLKAPTTQPAQ
ncbi:MAG: peptide-methionine (S)-S-oxide reductase MsrA [Phycisphaerales bacterium]|nr:peptide-methionine (S)-S-oxide reductase MsrA [Phycisphaerales bacterium]